MDKQEQLITRDQFDAVLFDLDGVITATAKVHADCWKRMFDDFLKQRSASSTEAFEPFEIESDYRLYVDGKPRYDGVSSFLDSRGISLPFGDSTEPPGSGTICGLGNRKSQMVIDVLDAGGVQVYEGSMAFLRRLRGMGIKTAVVSSSRNCEAVLQAARISELFDVRVDGKIAGELGLSGKPAPDTFLRAAEQLGVSPQRAVVIEDAISGVQAGRAGGFGLVIGVDRKGEGGELRDNGATVVVTDLGELL